MKKLLLGFSLLVFGFSLCEGQSWVWAKADTNNTNSSVVDPEDLTTDNSGNIFETGVFDGNINFGPVNLIGPSSLIDAFLVKYDNNGNAIWGVAPNTRYEAVGASVATNKFGNICLAGNYIDTMKIGTYIFPGNNIVNINFFLALFSSSGLIKWGFYSKTLNSGSNIEATSAIIDKAGNIYTTGYFIDSVSIGSFKLYADKNCFFLAKFDSNGNSIWVKTAKSYSFSTSSTIGSTIVSDTGGNVYVAGSFSDTITIGSTTIISKSESDVFLAKFTPSGNLTWITSPTLPSALCSAFFNYTYHNGRFLSIDNAGNLYLTGKFIDTAQFGTYRLTNKYFGIFLTKYSPLGVVLWAKQSSPFNNIISQYYQPFAISSNSKGKFFLSGTFQDTLTFGSIKLASDSTYPSFLFEFDSSGIAVCASEVNNDNDDWNPVSTDPLSNGVFFSGDIDQEDGCYFGSYLLTSKFAYGQEFGFLAKWVCDTNTEESIPKPMTTQVDISLFPNPNTGALTLEVKSEELGAKSVEIYNVMGQKVFSSNYSLSTNHYSLDLSSQPSGIYLYRVIDETGKLIGEGKFVIEK